MNEFWYWIWTYCICCHLHIQYEQESTFILYMLALTYTIWTIWCCWYCMWAYTILAMCCSFVLFLFTLYMQTYTIWTTISVLLLFILNIAYIWTYINEIQDMFQIHLILDYVQRYYNWRRIRFCINICNIFIMNCC